MNAVKLYNELDTFYNIRGDRYGYKYLSSFIQMITKNKIKPHQYMEFFERNKDHIGTYEKSTTANYQGVLKQFIRYITVVENINVIKSKPKQHPKKRGKTKIYDSFQSFQRTNTGKYL